ncbi:MAG: sugar ABC transporter permease [Anaerolineae bacterium]|nr:sugar ABC transporter permease [Anaerolineae bacterium]
MVGQSGVKRWVWVMLFLSPGLLGLLVFIVGPVIFSLGLTTFEWNLLTPPQFIGLQNYASLGQDPRFWAALEHTALYTVLYVPAVMAVAFMLALLLNQPLRGRAFFRMAFYVPVVSSWVAVSMMWRWIFNPQYGLMNFLLGLLGIQGPAWLFDPATALYAVVIASVWKDSGFSTVLFLAGLQGIPHEYQEAAQIDGANAFQRLRYITLPLITPTAFFVLITTLIGAFQVFDQMYLMPVEYAQRGTTVLVQLIVNNAFRYQRMGYAATLSWVLFAVIFAITVVQLRLQKRWVYYEL